MNNSLVCILPALFNNAGHEIDWLDMLTVIAKKKRLKVKFLLPKNNTLKKETNYKKVLFGRYETNFIIKLFYTIGNYFILVNHLKRLQKNDLVYIDGYSFYFLISLILYLLTNRNLTKLVIQIRYPYSNIVKKCIFKFFIYLFNKDLNNQLITITENTYLARSLSKRFTIKVPVLPSHHNIEKKNYIKNKKLNNRLNILCPGSFRIEKYGANLINFLENNIKNKERFILNIDKKFCDHYKKFYKFNIRFVKSSLEKNEYIKELNSCDLIILPYDFVNYELRTSGQFFEGISIGKIVFVTSNTLMSKDLKKNNLDELVVKDWSKKSIEQIINIKNDKLVRKKLINLKNKYIKLHSKKNLIKEFLKIIKK
jgi:hypothetical protein